MADLTVKPEHLAALQRLSKLHRPLYDAGWLDTDNPSVGFLICIAQGPWQQDRRFKLAEKAIDWLMKVTSPVVDLGHAYCDEGAELFPLKWQNAFTCNMITSLLERNILFRDKYDEWLTRMIQGDQDAWEPIVRELFDMCGAKLDGSKVLWLFARDVLQVPAFAVDRWVKRNLKKAGLPTNPWYLTRLCLQADVSPNELSRALFTAREGLEP